MMSLDGALFLQPRKIIESQEPDDFLEFDIRPPFTGDNSSALNRFKNLVIGDEVSPENYDNCTGVPQPVDYEKTHKSSQWHFRQYAIVI